MGRLIGSQIKEVCETFRTWGALWAMLPRGGAAVWGDEDLGAPEKSSADDVINFFLQMRDAGSSVEQSVNHTVNSALDMLFEYLAESNPHNVAEFSRAASRDSRQRLKKLVPDLERKTAPSFGDPLSRPLPYAANLKVYCLYGAGKPSERAYVYERYAEDPLRPYQLDVAQSQNGTLTRGVWQVDGDGSIPLLSLGYMCREWTRNATLNPANASTTTREYPHRALPIAVGGFQGTSEGDHVNIMGNEDLITDILTIVAGATADVPERLISDIDDLSSIVSRRPRRRQIRPFVRQLLAPTPSLSPRRRARARVTIDCHRSHFLFIRVSSPSRVASRPSSIFPSRVPTRQDLGIWVTKRRGLEPHCSARDERTGDGPRVE